jgi:NAD(P)-dependent dehydrogenase (short-subunit alcohol dehydrogenase family)
MNYPCLKGKTVLLFGACGVLGRAHAKAIAEAGAHLVIADLPTQVLKNLSRDLKCPFFGVDCRSEESIVSAISSAHMEFGDFDGAIYNVAITSEYFSGLSSDPFPAFEDYPLDLWNETLAVNLTGAFLFAREVSKYLKSASSSLVLVSSIYGVVGPDHSLYDGESFNTFPGYSASKAGILGLVRWLATLLAKKNIRVNALSPGGVFNGHSNSFRTNYSARTPMNRMASPSDITGAMIYLLSDTSVYMTGQNLIVDGGLTAW